jgi:CRP/FNR family cyclic AMP-dependent transcriptional regulator
MLFCGPVYKDAMLDSLPLHHAETESFAAGQVIFKAGEPGKVMYVIAEGEVEIVVGSEVVEVAGPGAIVGEMALIDQSPRSATVVAKTDCKLAPIDQRRFEFMVQQTPFFSLTVMKIMADRLRRTNSRIASA